MQIDGEVLFNQSRELVEKGENLDVAAEGFNRLLDETIHGKGNAAHIIFYLGCIHMKKKENAMALILFHQAVKHKENFIEAMNNLGFVYKEVGLFEDARKCFEKVWKVVEKSPDDVPEKDKADYLTNIGSLMIQNGTPEEALKLFDKALKFREAGPTTKWNKSLALLEMGRYEEGFAMYDFGERTERCKMREYGVPNLKTWWGPKDGEKPTVVVYGEQGIGDEIMFASVLFDAMKDANIVLDCHPRLIDLFRLNFPELPVYGTRKTEDEKIAWKGFHNIDAKIAMGSLCQFYRKKREDFPGLPYLQADPKMVEKYRDKLKSMGDRPKIGISWKGGVRSTGTNDRHIPLDLWVDLLKLDVDFISLQYNKDLEDEVAVFEKLHDVKLNHWPEMLYDYDETAGLVSNLDLVISAPQSVVHLAGALGVTTWQLCPVKAMWQCGPNGEDMPWYGVSKNFWQEEVGEWKPVLSKVKDEICNLLQTSTAA